MRPIACLGLILGGATMAGGTAAAAGKPAPVAAACIEKSGSATGITRAFAEYESLLIIRQVTGNWPIETDRIVAAKSSCSQGSALWTCVTRAKVCRG